MQNRKKKIKNTIAIFIALIVTLVIMLSFTAHADPLAIELPIEEQLYYKQYKAFHELYNASEHIESNTGSFNKDDVTEISNITSDMAEELLRGELRGLGKYFVKAEIKYGINARFMIAVSRLESGNGTYKYMDRNNLFSLGAYDSNPDNAFSYDSKEECIMAFAKLIKENYIDENGKYYNGKSIEAINIKYASSGEWAGKVIEIANEGMEE